MPMGRPRKSPAELKLAGTFNKVGSRKNWNTDTPYPAERRPAPQRYLQRTKVAWNKFWKVKESQNIVSEEDEILIVTMFNAIDDMFRIQDEIDAFERHPDFRKNMEDKKKRQHLLDMKKMVKMSTDTYISIGIRFGLTQSERTKLIVNNDKPTSPLIKLIQEVN